MLGEAFDLFDVNFSCDDYAVYTPGLVLWALLSQALFKDEQRSCNAAVTRIAAWWAGQGRLVDDTNSGAYCRARQVYQSRWWVELDIRSIKCSLEMDILRAKTPPMVRTELWSCLLAYNRTWMKMLQRGIEGSRDVRSMSFTRSLVLLITSWLLCGARGVNESLVELGQAQPLDKLVGHREGRIERRANKRRPKVLKLLTVPRAVYQAKLGSDA